MKRSQKLFALARRAAWAPLSVYVLHTVAAAEFKHEPYVDPVMHFLGGAAIAFFIASACGLEIVPLGLPSTLAVALIALGLTSVVGLVWELAELFSDFYLGSHTQVSVANTLRDLTLDTLGAMVFLVAAAWWSRLRSTPDE